MMKERKVLPRLFRSVISQQSEFDWRARVEHVHVLLSDDIQNPVCFFFSDRHDDL